MVIAVLCVGVVILFPFLSIMCFLASVFNLTSKDIFYTYFYMYLFIAVPVLAVAYAMKP